MDEVWIWVIIYGILVGACVAVSVWLLRDTARLRQETAELKDASLRLENARRRVDADPSPHNRAALQAVIWEADRLLSRMTE